MSLEYGVIVMSNSAYPPLARWRRRLAEGYLRRGLHASIVYHKFPGHIASKGEDLCQVAAMALCLAAQQYNTRFRLEDGQRAKFITYAWRCIYGRILNYLNYERSTRRGGDVRTTSLDALDKGEAGLLHSRTYIAPELAVIDARHDLEIQLAGMRRRYVEVLEHRANGETYRAIAKQMGVSHERIRQIERRAHEILKKKPKRGYED